MTALMTTNTGSFPRIGEGKGGQRLRAAFSYTDKGMLSQNDLLAVEREVTSEVIKLQIKAGIDLVTDGQIRWNDPISHVLKYIAGIDIGPLIRFFDTNFYYRQPIIKKKVLWQKSVLADDFIFAQRISKRSVKPVITGPYVRPRLWM